MASAPDGVLSVGGDVTCRWADGQPYRCRIIERRPARAHLKAPSGAKGVAAWEYYVHYHGMNRRLDEWVTPDRFVYPLAEASAAAAGAFGLHSNQCASSVAQPPLAPALKTRKAKRRIDELAGVSASEELLDPTAEREHEEVTKVKHIHRIVMGPFEVSTWYFSPFPEAYGLQPLLFICEYSLKYFKTRRAYERQLAACALRSPPGHEVYRAPAPRCSALPDLAAPSHLTVWEVDGARAKVYSQCLCLLAKLFLDHKTLYYDTDPFLFYVLCELDPSGSHRIVGYFSKEKVSAHGHNLACILVLPPHQRKGYGKLLISLAYELSKREGRAGAPEKPLSDLGQVTFRSYWSQVLLDALKAHGTGLTLKQLSALTAIRHEDVLSTLQSLNAVAYNKGEYAVSITAKAVEARLRASPRRHIGIDPTLLRWSPPSPPLPGTPTIAAGATIPGNGLGNGGGASKPRATSAGGGSKGDSGRKRGLMGSGSVLKTSADEGTEI